MGTKLLSMWRKLYSHGNEVFSLLRGGGEVIGPLELQVSSIEGLYFHTSQTDTQSHLVRGM